MTMEEEAVATTCYIHPDRATGLSCTTCGRPICVECSHDASVGQKCPECAAPPPRSRIIYARNTTGRPTFQTAPVSFTIMAITLAIFVAGYLSPDIDRWLIVNLAQWNILVADGQWYRIFTAALLHGGLMHVGFNMYALYLFGPRLEHQVGGTAFASLYVAAAAAGGFVAYIVEPLGRFPLIGASGAIFGLFGAWLFVAWKMRKTPGGRSMFNQLGVLLLINMALPFMVPNISWQAHLGGFAAGVLIAWLWSVLAVGKPNAQAIRAVVAIGVTVAIVFATITL
jgi:membrane associated rhomboid family serine protease